MKIEVPGCYGNVPRRRRSTAFLVNVVAAEPVIGALSQQAFNAARPKMKGVPAGIENCRRNGSTEVRR